MHLALHQGGLRLVGRVDRALEGDLDLLACGDFDLQPGIGGGELAGAVGQQRSRLAQGGVAAFKFGEPLPFSCHVKLVGKEIGQRAVGRKDRGDQQTVPERLPVPAVVADVDLDRFGGRYGGSDRGDRGRVGVRPLQEATVTADDFVPGITGQTTERIVGEDDRIVGLPGVGEQRRHARRLHRSGERHRSVLAWRQTTEAGGFCGGRLLTHSVIAGPGTTTGRTTRCRRDRSASP